MRPAHLLGGVRRPRATCASRDSTADTEPGQADDEDAVEITTQQRIAE
jgi:hypothetical protein